MTYDQQNPITPPPELRRLWAQEAQRISPHDPVEWMQYVSEKASQWGANIELEACCEWLSRYLPYLRDFPKPEDILRATRRPKPPSLKEQAEAELKRLIALIPTEGAMAMAEPIRRALEALPDDL